MASPMSPMRLINNDLLMCPNAPKKNIIVDYYNYKYSNINIKNIINHRRLSTEELQPTIVEEYEPPHKKFRN